MLASECFLGHGPLFQLLFAFWGDNNAHIRNNPIGHFFIPELYDAGLIDENGMTAAGNEWFENACTHVTVRTRKALALLDTAKPAGMA